MRIPGPLTDKTPFVDMDIWRYLKAAPSDRRTVKRYLDSLGFVNGIDKISKDEYTYLHYAVEHYLRTAPVLGPMKFEEAFTPVGGKRYYIAGKPGRYEPAPVVRAALIASGWVYDPSPQTTYFEIIHGKVWAKYQQIIGQRALFEIVP